MRYALALPFDLRCESGTYAVYTTAGAFEDSRDHGIYIAKDCLLYKYV